jgi:hypothetical protein
MDSDDDVSFHWDKDYSLESADINLHPHIASVTYLSDFGAPTVILDKRETLNYGQDFSESVGTAFVSIPRIGKHLSFDGALLHAAPLELKTLIEKGVTVKDDDDGTKFISTDKHRKSSVTNDSSKGSKRQKKDKESMVNKRVTLLINIWLNHKPADAVKLPNKLVKQIGKLQVPLNKEAPPSSTVQVEVVSKSDKSLKQVVWNFGEEDKHCVDMLIPTNILSKGAVDTDLYKIVYSKGCLINVM